MEFLLPEQTHNLNIIEKLLNINTSIEENFFKKTCFLDKDLEDSFLSEENKEKEKSWLKPDVLIIVGWVAIITYILIAYYSVLFFVSASFLFSISIILVFMKYFSKSQNYKIIIDHLLVFIMILYLNFKSLYILFYISTKNEDMDGEIIRTITYNWVAANMLLLTKLDGRPWVNVSITLMNFVTIILIHVYSINNHFYYLDAISNLPVAFITYGMKKAIDLKMRKFYGEKYKNEKMSLYTLGFINGLNGFYMNIKSDGMIFCGSKMQGYIEKINREGINGSFFKEFEEDNPFIFSDSLQSNLPQLFLHSLKIYDKKLLPDDSFNEHTTTAEKKESLAVKIKSFQKPEVSSTINFVFIGKYYVKSAVEFKYYDVYYRKFKITDTNFVYDLMFYESTDLIVSLLKFEEVTNQKHQILGKLVHEFKTPLTSILGLIDNIKVSQETDNKLILQNFKIIKGLSSYAIFLISDMIYFSSSKKAEEINILMQQIDVRSAILFSFDVLNSLISCSKSKSDAVSTELEFDEDAYHLTVEADETRLKQIMLNLISNAVKFTNFGLIKIKCFKHPEKELLLISVSDSGAGIKETNQKMLFNHFFMESEVYASNSLGSGLGLSICKTMANKMNMEISFKSNYGQGTEFIIEIPIVKNLFKNKIVSGLVNELEEGNENQSLDEENSMSFRVSLIND